MTTRPALVWSRSTGPAIDPYVRYRTRWDSPVGSRLLIERVAQGSSFAWVLYDAPLGNDGSPIYRKLLYVAGGLASAKDAAELCARDIPSLSTGVEGWKAVGR